MRCLNHLALILGILVGASALPGEWLYGRASTPSATDAESTSPMPFELHAEPATIQAPVAAITQELTFDESEAIDNDAVEEVKAIDRAVASQVDKGELHRLAHAKELLGKYYSHSVVRTGEKITELKEIRKFVDDSVRKALPTRYRKLAGKVSKAIMNEAAKRELDPIFLMAVIRSESSFNPRARGSAGEIGLMQLMPQTGRWVAHRFHLPWKGAKTLYDPCANIRVGAAYFSYLRERFDSHSRLYLAAYNMGSTNVDRALDRNIWPKDYPKRVMRRYVGLYSELRQVFLHKSRAPAVDADANAPAVRGSIAEVKVEDTSTE